MKQLPFVLSLVMASTGISQPFQNLDFEQYDPTTRLLPGWRILEGSNSYNHPPLNFKPLTLGAISIYGAPSGFPREGNYSLGLLPKYDDFGPAPTHAYIPMTVTQVGDIPIDARSIQFFNWGSSFELRADDTPIPLAYDYSLGPGEVGIYYIARAYGDISAFAGQEVELKFITLKGTTIPGSAFHGLDSIRFSPEPIPEPSTWAFLGFGSFALLLSRLYSRSASHRSCR